MSGRNPDPYRKGGPHDDVAQNIRNEQMRDAAPSPAEAREEQRHWLADQGCIVCGEDDPDVLGLVMPGFPMSCGVYQPDPNARGTVFCDEHARSSRELWWAEQVYRARKRDALAIVAYTCGGVAFADMPDFPDGKFNAADSWDDIPPSRRPTPEVPIRCDCGAGIDDVTYLDGRDR